MAHYVDGHALLPEFIPVTCDEAREYADRELGGGSRKRRRTESSSSDAEDGLRESPYFDPRGLSRNIVVSEPALPLEAAGGDSTPVPGEFAAVLTTASPPAYVVYNGSDEEDEEDAVDEADGDDEEDSDAAHEDGQEEEEEEEDDDDDSSLVPTEAVDSEADTEEDASDQEGHSGDLMGQIMAAVRLGGGQVLFIAGGMDDEPEQVQMDPLENPRAWRNHASGPAVRASMQEVVDLLNGGMLSNLIQFPFSDLSEPDILFGTILMINETFNAMPPIARPLKPLIASIPTLRRWRTAVAAVAAVLVNHNDASPVWEANVQFARQHLFLYRDFLRMQRTSESDLFTVDLMAALGDWDEEPSNESASTVAPDVAVDVAVDVAEEGTTAMPGEFAPVGGSGAAVVWSDDAVKPQHATIVCPACHAFGVKRPQSLVEWGAAVLTTQKDSAWRGKRRPMMRKHLMDLIEFASTAAAEEVTPFCKQFGDTTLSLVFERIVNTQGADELSRSEIVLMISFAQACEAGLSLHSRRDMVAELLFDFYPSLMNRPSGNRIEVAQSTAGMDLLQECLDALSTMSKLELMAGGVNVRFTGSRSIGDGPRIELITKVIAEAFKPANGLFVYSDDTESYLKPAPLAAPGSARDRQERYLRQIGRYLGLAIRDAVSAQVFLTPGALSLLRLPTKPAEENILVLTQWALVEAAEATANLLKLREEIGAAVGMPFPSDDRELDDTNVEAFILESLKDRVLTSITPQMELIVRGIYDVLPFPQLAYLGVAELADLLEGSRVIDRAQLRRTAEFVLPPRLTAASVPELQWLWEIVDEMTDDQVKDLVQFVSGVRSQPIHGFGGVSGERTWMQVKLDPVGIAPDQVPQSQLCFTQLKLPRYSSKEIMRARLLFAISNCKSVDQL